MTTDDIPTLARSLTDEEHEGLERVKQGAVVPDAILDALWCKRLAAHNPTLGANVLLPNGWAVLDYVQGLARGPRMCRVCVRPAPCFDMHETGRRTTYRAEYVSPLPTHPLWYAVEHARACLRAGEAS